MLVEVTACQLQVYRPFTFPLTLLELRQPCENKQTSLLQYEGPTGKSLSHSRWSHIRPVSPPATSQWISHAWPRPAEIIQARPRSKGWLRRPMDLRTKINVYCFMSLVVWVLVQWHRYSNWWIIHLQDSGWMLATPGDWSRTYSLG